MKTNRCDGCGCEFVPPKWNRKQKYHSLSCSAKASVKRRFGDWKKRFWENVRKFGADECWPWIGPTCGHGKFFYGVLGVGGATLRATHLSCGLDGRTVPEGLIVRHICDNPICVNPAHLLHGTHKENFNDCRMRNRNSCLSGESNPAARLGAEQVASLRKRYALGDTTGVLLAEQAGVSKTCVYEVLRGRTWKCVPIEDVSFAKKASWKKRARGECASKSKLTARQVLEIRDSYAGGQTSYGALGKKYGVSRESVRAIVVGKNWKHLLPSGDAT